MLAFVVGLIGLLMTGDLIFEVASDGDMSSAIAESTAQYDSIKFSHVGIILIDNQGQSTSVLEAVPDSGVIITPLEEFMQKATSGAVVKRLDADCDFDRTIERAKSYLGHGYDWWYLPDNEEIYCSELVEKSYVSEDGKLLFTTIPMNFRDEDGNMPEFWINLFERLGRPVPEGVAGTNPTQLSHSPSLRTIAYFSHEGESPVEW